MLDKGIELNEFEDPTFENDTMIAVRSNNLKNNTLIGSYVIIPKSEVTSPFELSEKEWEDTKKLMQELKDYLDKKYSPDGYNIGWNVGKAAGQEVKHAHLHIIPRFSDEPYAWKGIRYWFKQPENVRKSLITNDVYVPKKYKVITLCGSTKFKDDFIREQKRLTLEGNIVLTVGMFGHSGDNEVWTENTKSMLDDMHKRKIDMADEIFVINKGGYIGTSTKSEIEYALKTNKKVVYMEKV